MKSLLISAAAAAGLLLVTGCETISGGIDTGREYAGRGAAAAVEGECALSLGQRAENLAAVNNTLAERGAVARAPALDCNGDGMPDELPGAQ